MRKRNLRILYTCDKLPYPPDVGVRQRIFNIGRLLQKHGEVTIAIVSPFFINDTTMNENHRFFKEIEVFSAFENAGRSPFSKCQQLFAKHNVGCRYRSLTKDEQDRFLELARAHDITWFHTLRTADSTGIYSLPYSVVDLDDVNSEKYKLDVRTRDSIFEKARMKWRELLWRRWERDAMNRFTMVCVCSSLDKDIMGGGQNICVVPNGFKSPASKPIRTYGSQKRLGFIGALRYYPNEDGVLWFVRDVLPYILKIIPDVRFRVIGKLPSSGILCNHPSVDFLGFVDDSTPEMSTWSACIVPLRIGGGTRIKILDAFSKKCPVVSTPLGAYGLSVKNNCEIILADDAAAFADACTRLLEQPETSKFLAEAGWSLFQHKYTWDSIAPVIEKVVEQCLSG